MPQLCRHTLTSHKWGDCSSIVQLAGVRCATFDVNGLCAITKTVGHSSMVDAQGDASVQAMTRLAIDAAADDESARASETVCVQALCDWSMYSSECKMVAGRGDRGRTVTHPCIIIIPSVTGTSGACQYTPCVVRYRVCE